MENTQNTETNTNAPNTNRRIGAPVGRLETFDTELFADIPMFAVGKEWLPNERMAGRYIGSQVARSNKLINGESLIHVLEDEVTKERFGLWSVGGLAAFFNQVKPGIYVNILYKGYAKKALKPGQSEPHDFNYGVEKGYVLGQGINLV